MITEPQDVVRARYLVANTARSMLFETALHGDVEPGRSLLFQEPLQWLEAIELDQLPTLFAAIEEARQHGFWVAGYFAYECGYHWEPTAMPHYRHTGGDLPLAAFGIYTAPIVCLPATHEDANALGVTNGSHTMSPETFVEEFQRVQDWIAAGDTYQVNLTFRLESAYSHGAAALFSHMMHAQPVEFGALLNLGISTIASASPELFFKQAGREIQVRPMKGTSKRGRDEVEDDYLASALAADAKNRAENVMIVDLLRNDLGRVSEIGSVHATELFSVERHPSLLQMTSTVRATLRPEVDLYQLFASIFPSGSIVGAPKIRTMQLIRDLEERDRGVYTGAIGFFSPDDEAVFSVAIRTAILQGDRLTMGIGAGITSSSVAEAEYEECLLKSKFVQEQDFNLIESMRWQGGQCDLLEFHLDRLAASSKLFGFDCSREQVRNAIVEFATHLAPSSAWKVSLEMTKGGNCMFRPAEPLRPEPGPFHALLWAVPVHSDDLWLRHKTTRRKVYDEAVRAARQADCIDAIFINERGAITEGAIHSIFVRHGDRWRTPPLSAGILPGVFRRKLLLESSLIQEEEFDKTALLTADEIWLTNAVRGVRQITILE